MRRAVLIGISVIVTVIILIASKPPPLDTSKFPDVIQEPIVTEKLVLAAYYPWYSTPEVSGAWGHWKVDGRELVTNHPINGFYDSSDPEVIKEHLALAERAKIDGFAVSWWGTKDIFIDENFKRMLDVASDTNSNIKLAVHFESPHIPNFANEIKYIIDNYGDHENYLRVQGKPVIFVYNPGTELTEWILTLQELKSDGYEPFLVGDTVTGDDRKVFSGSYMYGPLNEIVKGYENTYNLYTFADNARKDYGGLWVATVLPGFNDTPVRSPTIIERHDGTTYDNTWRAAMNSNADWVFITSWNEWHEGSEIEPSVEHSDRYINLTAGYVSEFKK